MSLLNVESQKGLWKGEKEGELLEKSKKDLLNRGMGLQTNNDCFINSYYKLSLITFFKEEIE